MTSRAVPSADTADLPVLPDFTRGARTLERMLEAFGAPRAEAAPRADARARAMPVPAATSAAPVTPSSRSVARPRRPSGGMTLRPEHTLGGTLVRSLGAAVLLGCTGSVLLLALLGVTVGASSVAPAVLALLLLGGGMVAVSTLVLGVRLGAQALAVARGRVELDEDGIAVVGPIGRRRVRWGEVRTVSARTVHPVLGVVAALRLEDGRSILLPSTTRPVWQLGRTADPQVLALREQLAVRRGGIRRRGARSRRPPRADRSRH